MLDPATGYRPQPRRVTRRAALRWGGQAMLGAVAATACGARAMPARAPSRVPALAPVNVSRDRIIRRVVGLRPYRPAGFRLGAARMGDQVVVHNYGHGGGGITLSWGTAELAAREAEAAAAGQERRAAVLGCGVVGLATARLLQLRGWAVTLDRAIARARDNTAPFHTESAGSAWRAFLRSFGGMPSRVCRT